MVLGLALSVVICSLLFAFNIIDLRYIGLLFLYAFIALLIGTFLWLLGLWSAGDAKLYVIYLLLIPLTTYKYVELNFPILPLLVNTVLPASIYLLAKLILKTNAKQKWTALKKTLNWKNLLIMLLSIFSMSWVTTWLFTYLGIQRNYLYNIIAITILSVLMQKTFQEQTLPLMALISLMRIFVDQHQVLSYSFITFFLITTLCYAITRMTIDRLSDIYTEKVRISDLKAGMLPAEIITKQGFKIDIRSARKSFFNKTEALTPGRISAIQNARREGRLHFNNLRIQQTIPLAPFLFLGTAITIICQGDAVLAIRSLLNV
jgi:hypothetical protein